MKDARWVIGGTAFIIAVVGVVGYANQNDIPLLDLYIPAALVGWWAGTKLIRYVRRPRQPAPAKVEPGEPDVKALAREIVEAEHRWHKEATYHRLMAQMKEDLAALDAEDRRNPPDPAAVRREIEEYERRRRAEKTRGSLSAGFEERASRACGAERPRYCFEK